MNRVFQASGCFLSEFKGVILKYYDLGLCSLSTLKNKVKTNHIVRLHTVKTVFQWSHLKTTALGVVLFLQPFSLCTVCSTVRDSLTRVQYGAWGQKVKACGWNACTESGALAYFCRASHLQDKSIDIVNRISTVNIFTAGTLLRLQIISCHGNALIRNLVRCV